MDALHTGAVISAAKWQIIVENSLRPALLLDLLFG
jgi:hypothetical protein